MQACGLHPQALTFSFSIPSSWGQESLALFENLGDQCLVLVGEQLSVLRSQLAWALGVFGVAVWIVSVASELWDPDTGSQTMGSRGQGRQGRGAFSAARHSVNGGAVGALGHGQLGRGQQLGNQLLAPNRKRKVNTRLPSLCADLEK